jgi:hypothetical protein
MTLFLSVRGRWWLVLVGLLLGLGSVGAASNREFRIVAPSASVAGARIEITVEMSTDAGEGEHIAFLQAEYSVDGGRTWTGCWAEDKLGPRATRSFGFTAGAAGTESWVRARVAYRGGVAGAVDCTGTAIRWFDTWKKWREPPAKSVRIAIEERGNSVTDLNPKPFSRPANHANKPE